jgi:sodium/potassium-transporting ATPase subunit alpha
VCLGSFHLIILFTSYFSLPAAELVAGDIVKITLGCKIPADLRLIHTSSDLRFDRSILTGESKDVPGIVEPTDANCVSNLSMLPHFISHSLQF